ncbi:hypothetical protein AAMO2058_001160900 [Amorphochlora amoebiformis]
MEIHTWDSQQIASIAVAIVAKEAMGYDIEWVCASSGLNAIARIANGDTDAITEFWYDNFYTDVTTFVTEQQVVTDGGVVGYKGRSRLYVPKDYTSKVYSSLDLGYAAFSDFVSGLDGFWKAFEIKEIVQLYANANDTEIIQGLTLNSRFTPEWCFTWSADGVGNNCIDVKGAYPTYDQGWLPQVIRNLKLNMTVSFWGYYGVQTYVTRKLEKKEVVLWKFWTPESFMSKVSYQTVAFPDHTDSCHSNNTNSVQGYGGVDCDFPSISIRKMINSKFRIAPSSEVVADFYKFYLLFQISSDQMENDLLVQAGIGISVYDVACNFITNHNSTWKSWVSNTYTPPSTNVWEIKQSEKFALMLSGSVVVAYLGMIAIIMYSYRSHEFIKGLSYNFSLQSIVGMIMLASSPFFVNDKGNDLDCVLLVCLPFLGVTVTVAALLAKTFRIYAIFAGLSFARKLTDSFLFTINCIPIGIMIIMLSVMTAAEGARGVVISEERENNVTHISHVCFIDSVYLYVISGFCSCLIMITTKLAYDSRDVPDEFNEAKELIFAMYTMVIIILVALPTEHSLRDKDWIEKLGLVSSIFELIAAVLVTTVLYGRRIFMVLFGVKQSATAEISRKYKSHHSGKLQFKMSKISSIAESKHLKNSSLDATPERNQKLKKPVRTSNKYKG